MVAATVAISEANVTMSENVKLIAHTFERMAERELDAFEPANDD